MSTYRPRYTFKAKLVLWAMTLRGTFFDTFLRLRGLRFWTAITTSLATMHASLYRRSDFVLDMKVLGEKCNIEESLAF